MNRWMISFWETLKYSWWRLIAWIKSISASTYRSNINQIYEDLLEKKKNKSLINKAGKIIDNTFKTTKKKLDSNKKPFLDYVEFCRSKGIEISNKDKSTVDLIEKAEDLLDPKGALDRELQRAYASYNESYSLVNDAGEKLLDERNKCLETIDTVEDLVNSIAACPKEFDKYIRSISIQKKKFKDTKEFGMEQEKALKNTLKGTGAGVAAGAAVASMAPTAAMWVATTFGTASTGTAISALSGAAATNAALAWLGGGALAAGGSGMAAGQAFLALAGPVGWGVAGTSLLISALLFWKKSQKIQENKKKEIERMKNCSERLKELKEQIEILNTKTVELKKNVSASLDKCNRFMNSNYKTFTEEEKQELGALVNNTNSLSTLLNTTVTE